MQAFIIILESTTHAKLTRCDSKVKKFSSVEYFYFQLGSLFAFTVVDIDSVREVLLHIYASKYYSFITVYFCQNLKLCNAK